MPPLTRSVPFYSLILGIALVTASCSGPTGPSLSPEQTVQALSNGQAEVDQAVQSFGESEAGKAISQVLAVGGLALPMGAERMATAAHGEPPLPLPRDVMSYEFDSSTGEWGWAYQGESTAGNLERNWEYGEGQSASFVVDWDASESTIEAHAGDFHSVEAPRGLRATLEADGAEVGRADATFAYYTSDECGVVYQPVSHTLEGYLGGGGDMLTFEASYALAESSGTDTLTSTGDVDLSSGAHSAGVNWNLTVTGNLERADCYQFPEITPTGANVSLGAYAGDSSLQFSASVSEIVYDAEGGPTSLDLSGSLYLNGQLAVAFNGTLDDGDGDQIPGENLTLTFAGEETVTLEQYIRQNFTEAMAALAAAAFLN